MPVKAFMLPCAVSFAAALSAAEPTLHSSLADGDWRLTPLGADTRTLEDRHVYYVRTNTTFTGRAATDRSTAGESALTVASNACVYIYIPAGTTLTCRGGAGCDAASGEGRKAPVVSSGTLTEYGVRCNYADFSPSPAGAGGAGASGGGAGIFVPFGSTLAIFGAGELIVRGGAGGAAAAGQTGTDRGGYVAAAWCAEKDADIQGAEKRTHVNNIGIETPGWAGSSKDGWACLDMNGLPTSGGGGGGGAGGGGAAIGTSGAFGTDGKAGGALAADTSWTNCFSSDVDACFIGVVPGELAGKDPTPASAAGIVYLDVGNAILEGGSGGTNATTTVGLVTNLVTFTAWDGELGEEGEHRQEIQLVDGANGGAGGAGGKGADVGTGGGGGAGGGGGGSGSMTCAYSTSWKPVTKRSDLTPSVGGAGVSAADGSGEAETLSEQGYPYNLVRFGSEEQRYVFSRGTAVAVPHLESDFAGGWAIETAAKSAEGLPVDSTAFLTNGPSLYEPEGEVRVGTNTYGDVSLTSRCLRVTAAQGKAEIGIRRDSAFFKNRLQPLGGLSAMEDWLDGAWNGDRRWLAYVLGMDIDRQLVLDISEKDDRTGFLVRPMSAATNGVPGLAALEPPVDSGFFGIFRYYGTNDLSAAVEDWPYRELVGRDGAAGLSVERGGQTSGFWRLKAKADPAIRGGR